MPEAKYDHALEPESLSAAFLRYPPQDFIAQPLLVQGREVPAFVAVLDLFTTMDDSIRRKVSVWRQHRIVDALCRALLAPRVYFIGTTVSEYCLIHRALSPEAVADTLHARMKQLPGSFCIVKDLPLASPLLSREENSRAHTLLSLLEAKGFLSVIGQALAYLPIDFDSMEAYLGRLSKERRKDFRRKIKLGQPLRVEEQATGTAWFTEARCAQLYAMYAHVYAVSDVHFDKLTPDFFTQVLQRDAGGMVFLYYLGAECIGFNLCYVSGRFLVDKYWGFLPEPAREHALFFNSFFANIEYCLRHGLTHYIVGWTAARAKASLGCKFTYTRHAVYIKHPLLRFVLRRFKSAFEGDHAMIGEEVPHGHA